MPKKMALHMGDSMNPRTQWRHMQLSSRASNLRMVLHPGDCRLEPVRFKNNIRVDKREIGRFAGLQNPLPSFGKIVLRTNYESRPGVAADELLEQSFCLVRRTMVHEEKRLRPL